MTHSRLTRITGTSLNILLAVVSVGLTLYALEIGLWALRTARGALGGPAQVADFERPRPPGILEVVADLRDRGVGAYPLVLPFAWLQPDGLTHEGGRWYPLSSITSVPTVFCHRGDGEYVTWESDEHGFNNPPGTWARPVPDVALVGDSFAHGFCVARGDDIAGVLREAGVRAVSLGMSASGPLAELGILTEYGHLLRPRVVLWLYFEGNDLRNLAEERESSFLRAYLSGDGFQALAERRAETDAALREYVEARLRRGHAGLRGSLAPGGPVRALKLTRLRSRLGLTGRKSPAPPASPADVGEVLARAKSLVETWEGRLVLVYLPARGRYRGVDPDADRFSRDGVLAEIERLDIPVLDVHELLSAEPDPAQYYERAHLTERGYAKVAHAIRSFLEALEGASR